MTVESPQSGLLCLYHGRENGAKGGKMATRLLVDPASGILHRKFRVCLADRVAHRLIGSSSTRAV